MKRGAIVGFDSALETRISLCYFQATKTVSPALAHRR
jgi:hypothetical protein